MDDVQNNIIRNAIQHMFAIDVNIVSSIAFLMNIITYFHLIKNGIHQLQ